jgi:hypothetical protein
VKFFSSLYCSTRRGDLLKLVGGTLLSLSITLVVLWSPLKTRWQGILDPYSFNGDALQHIAPMWFVHSASDSVQDYTLRYYLQAILPPLFKGIYALATLTFTPAAASKVLTVFLSAAFIITSAATARAIGGGIAGALALFLATAGVVKNLYFMGGIQRGFGFCIASIALYLVCSGHVVPLAFLGIIAAMLYPAAAVSILTVLGLLIMLPSTYRGSLANWRLSRRLGLLVLTTLLIGIAVTPQIVGGHKYGQRLSIDAANHFEEWGPHGRYTPGDRGVPVNLGRKILTGMVSALSVERPAKKKGGDNESAAEQIALVVIALSLMGGLLSAIRQRFILSPSALRCCVFFLGSVIAFGAASILFPMLYIPSRYIALGVTALSPVIFPALWSAIIRFLMPSCGTRFANLGVLLLGTAIISSLGWFTMSSKSLPTASGNRALFAFIQSLPQDAVIASWPRGIANMIPLFTGRSTLIFEEGHQIFHRDVLEEMRRRSRAMIAVYAATDLKPIQELATNFSVPHLLINKRHVKKIPDYFAPFGKEMKAAREKIGSTPLVLTELARTQAVYTDNDYIVIDIRNLRSE